MNIRKHRVPTIVIGMQSDGRQGSQALRDVSLPMEPWLSPTGNPQQPSGRVEAGDVCDGQKEVPSLSQKGRALRDARRADQQAGGGLSPAPGTTEAAE